MRSATLIAALAACSIPLAACAGGSPGPGAAASPSAALPDATATTLAATLDDWVAAQGVVGATAAVVTPDGEWAAASGEDAAGTALAPETAMIIASISKSFTAAEVVLLAAQGTVDLDAPVTDYLDLPWDTAGATVRQMLAMSDGFPSLDDEAYGIAISADLAHRWTVDEMLGQVDTDGPRMGTLGAPAIAGEEATWYNSVNYLLAAELVETVTGGTLAAALHHDLLDPAGLTRVFVQPDEAPSAPVAVAVDDPDRPVVDPGSDLVPSTALASAAVGAGSYAADALDVARFGRLLVTGTLLGDRTDEMLTGHQGGDYGLGVYRADWGEGTVIGHPGTMAVTSTLFFAWQDTGISIAAMVPQGMADHPGPMSELLERLYAVVRG